MTDDYRDRVAPGRDGVPLKGDRGPLDRPGRGTADAGRSGAPLTRRGEVAGGHRLDFTQLLEVGGLLQTLIIEQEGSLRSCSVEVLGHDVEAHRKAVEGGRRGSDGDRLDLAG